MKKYYPFCLLISFSGFLSAQLPEKNILLHTQNDKIENLLAIDFNNDGWTDYFSLSGTSGLFYENDGSNTWFGKYTLSGFSDSYITQTIATDIDGDGWTDIVAVKDITYTTLSWYKNPGNLTDPWVNHLIGPSMNFLIGIFDVDADGDDDLVYENSTSYLYWTENTGGLFTLSHFIPDDYPSIRVAAVYDFDKDGDQDWTAYFYDCCTDYFENNGDGTFSTSTVSTDENQDDIFIGDADGDGYTDIVVEDAFNFGVAIFDTIDGDFNLDIPWDYSSSVFDIQLNDLDDDGDNDWLIFENDPLSDYTNMKWIESTGSSVNFDDLQMLEDSIPGNSKYVLLSDYNNDGKPDLIYDDHEQPMIALNEMPAGDFAASFKPDTSYMRMDLMTAFDVDGDSDNDLMVVSHDGKLAWFKYDTPADTFFSVHYLPNLSGNPYPSMLDHHDLDNDGDEDLIASFHTTTGSLQLSYYFLNNGNGIFTTYLIDSLSYNRVWFTDADSDGDEDMIAMQYASPHNLFLYLRYPDTTNLFIYTSAITTGSWKTFEMMDVDQDGDDDFIGAGTSSYILEIPNTDGYSFFGTQFNLFVTTCSSASSLFVNDFDNDGDEDISYACSLTGTAFIAYQTGGIFTPAETGEFTGASLSEQYKNKEADLNADGYPDLVLSDYINGTKIKLSAGAGTYQDDYLIYSTDFGEFADLDGDSLIDFAGTNDFEFYIQNDIDLINPSFTIATATQTWLQENGLADGITITFNEIPVNELIIDVSPTGYIDAGAGAGIPVSVSFPADSSSLLPHFIGWNVPDDTIVEDIATNYVNIAADPVTWGMYAGSISEDYTYTITDNDLGVFYTPAGTPIINEGSTTAFNVHINVIPASTTTMTLTPAADINLGAGAGLPLNYTLNPDMTSISNKVFYVSSPNDIYYEPVYNSSFSADFTSDDPVFSDFIPFDKILSVHDNDFVDLTRGTVGTYYYDEGVDNFAISVTISSEPYFDVYVIAMPDEQLDLGNGPGIADTITFLADGFANIGQVFSGIPFDDEFVEFDHTGIITFSVVSEDIYYDPLTLANLTVRIRDNDEETTSVSNAENELFNFYPAVSNGIFNFENLQLAGVTTLTVSNLLGQVVMEQIIQQTGNYPIDLSEYSNGNYIVTIQNNNQRYSNRIIIMK